MDKQTLADMWAEAHPMNMWRYDYPQRQMAWWEMPTYRALCQVRRLIMRLTVLAHLIKTPKNTRDWAPWDDSRLSRRLKCIAVLLLPIPVHWRYPDLRDADSVLGWWGSGVTSTPSGYSWKTYYVGVGYRWHLRAYIYEDGE